MTVLGIFYGFTQTPIAPYQTVFSLDTKVSFNVKSNNSINGDQYIFKQPLKLFSLDQADSTKLFVVIEANTTNDQIMKMDFATGSSIFGFKYNPLKNLMRVTKHGVISLDANGLEYFENEKGQLKYNLPLQSYFKSEELDIIAGYPLKKKKSIDELAFYSLTSGNLNNKVLINEDAGIERFSILGDSVVIISASGIHYIDQKNGRQWSYQQTTSEPKNPLSMPFNYRALGLGTRIAYYSPSRSTFDKTFGIASNLLIYKNHLYKSSVDEVVCLTKEGNVIWNKPLDSDITSIALLFVKDELLYHINLGYAFAEGLAVNRGNPFIAIFDLDTGKNQGFLTLGKGRSRITDFTVDSNYIYVLLDQKLVSFELGNLSNSKSIENKTKEFSELQYFAKADYYIIKDEKFRKYNHDTTFLYLLNKDNYLVVLDKQLNYIKKISDKYLWHQFDEFEDYKLLYNDKSIKVIKNHELICSFENVDNYIFQKGILLYYNVLLKRLVKVNLKKSLS